MRQVYRLLGLVRRYGPDRSIPPAQRALDLDVINVTKIASMLDRAREHPGAPRPGGGRPARFARDPAEYRPRPPSLLTAGGGSR